MRKRIQTLATFFVGTLFFATSGFSQYCVPSYGSNCIYGDDLDDFSITGAGLNHPGTGCSTAGYADYTADLGLVATMQPTVSYPFTATHNFSSQYVRIWIDFNNDQVFDNITELVADYAASGYTTTGNIVIPNSVAPVTGLRMRVFVSYAGPAPDACAYMSYGETHDYTVNISPAPPCPNPILLAVTSLSAFDAMVEWTEQGSANDYILEWGNAGFTPGTGTEVGTASINAATDFLITGLTPTTTYDFYVRANCLTDGLSFWAGPLSFTTLCVPVSTLPWTEGFETSTIGYNVIPTCWEHENLGWGGWSTYDNSWYWNDADALSGTNFLSCQYGSNAYIWTPQFEMLAGETYEFVFNWAGDGHSGWDGEVYVNSMQTSAGATLLGDKFVTYGELTTLDYQEEIYCFTPAADGNYSFGIYVVESDWWYYMNIDDMSVRVAIPVTGTDATYDICQTEGLIDLNSLGTILDPNGSWSFVTNPSAIEQDTLLNTTLLPTGVLDAVYSPKGCSGSDVFVTLNIIAPSSAGIDGTLDACMNQQINLLGGLSGTVNFGGIWYDESNTVLASPYFMTSTTPGSYDYEYVTSNGVCPNDTSMVTLTILDCDYLSLDELTFENITVYPNPTDGLFYISSVNGMSDLQFVVTDINGRTIVTSSATAFENSELTTVDLSDFEDGIYMLRLFNTTDQKVYRIVKN